MYLRHFSLREPPFSITPDTAFFYPHEGAQAALNTLLVALRSGEGFLKIVGEVGCGKTLLCRQLLHSLQDEFVTAYIPNPDMGPDDLLLALAGELGIELKTPLSRHQVLASLHDGLLQHAQANRSVLVCIDEAQATRMATLESLRLLSNLETEKRKLLQIVLFGQPELDELLAQPKIRQLLQRITFSEYLGGLQAERIPAYLAHRLAVAADDELSDIHVFDAQAARLLAVYSRGVPRLINVLAHKCLMLAYGENTHRVVARHVVLAAADTPGVRRQPSRWARWGPAGLWHRLHGHAAPTCAEPTKRRGGGMS
jgi:MSHA biogenesis protein MshM